jgi:hypothetical protein
MGLRHILRGRDVEIEMADDVSSGGEILDSSEWRGRVVPYFSQWESRELTLAVLADGPAAALARDPNWRSSGARDLAEYAAWANNICGMACLKMVLAARTGRIVPTIELARVCMSFGGYAIGAAGEIKGLIYAPFVRFIEQSFGINGEIVTRASARDLPAILRRADFFIASVHSSIRWPEREPPSTGGHLVLVIAASANEVIFHNPSGHDARSQEYARLDAQRFDRFFAGRGVAILR